MLGIMVGGSRRWRKKWQTRLSEIEQYASRRPLAAARS
jgi:hypothetical protein